VPDSLAEKDNSFSPYHYAGNNPISNVDYDGRFFGRTLSWLYYKFSINSTARENRNGNWIVKYNRNNKKRIRNFGGSWFKGRTRPEGHIDVGNLEESLFGNTVEYDDPNSGLAKYYSNLKKKPELQSGKADMQPAFFFNLMLGVKGIEEIFASSAEKGLVKGAAKGVTRSLDDLSSLKGAKWKEAESLIPKGWTRGPLTKGEGIKFMNPAKKGEQILLEKGWPGAKDPLHAGPYMKISRNGTVERIPLQGNPTLK